MTDSPVPTPEEILNDEGASDWLKQALSTALERDSVDALNDAEMLTAVLEFRLKRLMGSGEMH